jgi:hydroxymethylpyrimidine pyrophosphatase-like HAD family hydrolase
MKYRALATDFDGTLADDARVLPLAARALFRWREAGGVVVLVTGRELADLARVFPSLALFDRIVAENGALLSDPANGRERLLAPPADPEVVALLRRLGARPVSAGRAIVSTRVPHEREARLAAESASRELRLVYNRGAVMILPADVDKASGLNVALAELGIGLEQTVGVGDGENDLPFLRGCSLSVAVANALPSLRREVDLVTSAPGGAGVAELVERLLSDADAE